MLKAVDLTKAFSRKAQTFEAVSRVSLSLESGDLAILTGPSGCGKSTLFHLLCGITRPDRGQIFFDGTACFPTSPFLKTSACPTNCMPPKRGWKKRRWPFWNILG